MKVNITKQDLLEAKAEPIFLDGAEKMSEKEKASLEIQMKQFAAYCCLIGDQSKTAIETMRQSRVCVNSELSTMIETAKKFDLITSDIKEKTKTINEFVQAVESLNRVKSLDLSLTVKRDQ